MYNTDLSCSSVNERHIEKILFVNLKYDIKIMHDHKTCQNNQYTRPIQTDTNYCMYTHTSLAKTPNSTTVAYRKNRLQKETEEKQGKDHQTRICAPKSKVLRQHVGKMLLRAYFANVLKSQYRVRCTVLHFSKIQYSTIYNTEQNNTTAAQPQC